MGKDRTIRLLIEYDGTDYRGWQVQPDGPTVQEKIEAALRRLTGESVRVAGAGRTDAGVHAAGQVASFRTPSRLPAATIARALNALLPPDIAVLSAEEAAASFHARFSAVRKRYRYSILNRPVRPALGRRTVLHVPRSLDERAMREAARCLVGTHDFSSFRCNSGKEDAPVRTVQALAIERRGDLVTIEIEAASFLYKMVRSIAGTLIAVGRGKAPPSEVAAILAARDRSRAFPTAPACGLCLLSVEYP
jgi:tRNA pseudouridine38-40 synthase